ncbi:MAG: DegV family protein [Demequina sp.]|uniref:DegV family protein n=1 Tax=Demequina sp. TaxID=2050685 RepID=UPI0019951A16|nr:DegV family protein [Demequina sp.]MBC7298815.1 DegV family protein [Demequina sp.]
MNHRVVVATDSSSCLPAELAQAWRVAVAPLQIIIDDEPFSEGGDVSPLQVVHSLVSGRKVGTSQPGPQALMDVAEWAKANGAESLVFVSLSAKISGTAQAMKSVAERAPVPVTVVDSRTAGLAAGLAVLSASAVAAAGGGYLDVVAEAERASRSSMSLFSPDSLEYLRRGGRVGPAVAAVGRALGVKPELGLVDGDVVSIARHRSSHKARAAMLDRVASHAATMRHPVIGIMTLPGDDDLVTDARQVLSTRGDWPVLQAGLSAALAAHAGPGTLAVAVVDVHPDVAASL